MYQIGDDFERISTAPSSIAYRSSEENHRKVHIRDFRKQSTRNDSHGQTDKVPHVVDVHTASSGKNIDDDQLLNSLLSRSSQSVNISLSDSTSRRSDKSYRVSNRDIGHRQQKEFIRGTSKESYKNSEGIERGLQNELLRVNICDSSSLSSVSTVGSRSVRGENRVSDNYALRSYRQRSASDQLSETLDTWSETDLDEERFPTYLSANYDIQKEQSDTQSSYSGISTTSHRKTKKYCQQENSSRNFDGNFLLSPAVSTPVVVSRNPLYHSSSDFSDTEVGNHNYQKLSPRSQRYQKSNMRGVRRLGSRASRKNNTINNEKFNHSSPGSSRMNNNDYSRQQHPTEDERRQEYVDAQMYIQRRSLPETKQPRMTQSSSSRSRSFSDKAYDTKYQPRTGSQEEMSNGNRRTSGTPVHSEISMHEDVKRLAVVEESKPVNNSESGINSHNSVSTLESPKQPSIHSRKSSSGRGSQTSRAASRLSDNKNEMGDADSIGSATSVILRAGSRGSKSSGTHSVNMADPDDEILVGDEKDLHAAARRGDAETVQQLLEIGTDINCRNETDRTPIHWAAGNGHVTVLKILLERDANVEAADKFGMNALLWASWFGHKVCVEMLLRAGAKSTAKNKNGFTFLHCAAQNNHIMVEHILTEDLQEFDKNITDDVGRTCLHVLAKHGRKEMLEKFIELQCDVKAKDKAENTPLHLAAKYGFSELIPILIEAGADIEDKNSEYKTSLHLAAEEGKTEAVEELIRLEADVNAETEDEVCPLHLAVTGGHEETAIALINGGADVDAGNKHNQTPLHYAVAANKPSLVQILSMHDADPNVQDARRETPLHLATENGYYDITELLLHSEVNLSLADQRGKTPLDVAARGSYITIVDMILKAERHHLYLKSPHNQLGNGHAFDNNEMMNDVLDGLPRNISFKPDNSVETQHIRTILYKLATKYLKKEEWRKLAFQWGFTDSQVQAIEEQYTGERSYKEHGYRMLLIWLNGCILRNENPVRSLFEGLVAIQRRDVAETIRSKANSLQPDKACIIS